MTPHPAARAGLRAPFAVSPRFAKARSPGWSSGCNHVAWVGVVEITFYSDSMNDLPLLEKAAVPVATNPDDRLRALAQTRGWRILDLFS